MICACDARRGPQKSRDVRDKTKQCCMRFKLRVRWKVASDLRFQAAISEPKTPSFCRISGDLAQSTRKSLAIATLRFWCAKVLAKGVSAESSVRPKETKKIQGYWVQQYIWHSERHSQERRTFFRNPLLKPLFLAPEQVRLCSVRASLCVCVCARVCAHTCACAYACSNISVILRKSFWNFPKFSPPNQAGPFKAVSTRGVSMKRSNFCNFRSFYTVVSNGNLQKSPWSWIPLSGNPFLADQNLASPYLP